MTDIFPFTIKDNGTLTKYHYDRKTVDLSPYNNIKRITSDAFKNCKELTEIILPESLISIEDRAFSECIKLKKIYFPQTLTDIKGNPFENTLWLKEKLTKDGFASVNKTLLAINKSIRDDSGIRDVERINFSVFSSYDKVKKIDLSNMKDLKYVEAFAFYSCPSLQSVVFSKSCSLRSIEYKTFYLCPNLEDVTLPDALENIDGFAFYGTKWFKRHSDNEDRFVRYKDLLVACISEAAEIDLSGEDIRVICSRAFQQKCITSVIMPKSLKKIMNNSFDLCLNLQNVDLPDDLEYIGDYAFANCNNLDICLPPKTVVKGTAFAECYKEE